VLNSQKAGRADDLKPVSSGAEADSEESDTDLPKDEEISPTDLGKKFGEIKIGDLKTSMHFIIDHPEVVSERNEDGLMVEGFNAQLEGKEALSKQYVHQSLLLRYVKQVGRTGIQTFFRGYFTLSLDLTIALPIAIIELIKSSMTTSIPPILAFEPAQRKSFKNGDSTHREASNKFSFRPLILIPTSTSRCHLLIRRTLKSKKHERSLRHSLLDYKGHWSEDIWRISMWSLARWL